MTCLRDWHVFMWQSVEILNFFNASTLKQIFWKTKTFFKELEYRFLVESTKIENPSFSYITAISEVNVKTNRMVSTKWTYHKEQSFASNYFTFLKILFQYKNLLERVNLMYNHSNAHTPTFCKPWIFIWLCFFHVSVFKPSWKSTHTNKRTNN